MSGIPISGTTTGAAGGTLGVAGATGNLPGAETAGETTASLGASVLHTVEATATNLPFTGIGLLSLLVAAFTLLACGMALVSLVRPARRA